MVMASPNMRWPDGPEFDPTCAGHPVYDPAIEHAPASSINLGACAVYDDAPQSHPAY